MMWISTVNANVRVVTTETIEECRMAWRTRVCVRRDAKAQWVTHPSVGVRHAEQAARELHARTVAACTVDKSVFVLA